LLASAFLVTRPGLLKSGYVNGRPQNINGQLALGKIILMTT